MAWYDTDWSYRREITIDNTSGAAHTNFPVQVSLTSGNFDFANAETDGSDIRFTSSDETTVISYWIQDYDNGGETATIWVKVPSVAAAGDTTIYIYYGNSGASDTSAIADVFTLGEDFATATDFRGAISYADGASPGNKSNYSNPIIATSASTWKSEAVREPGNIAYNSDAGASEKYVFLYSGQDASGDCDVGVAFSADGETWSDYGSNPVISLAEDPYIVLNTDGTLYDDGTYFYVYFERKSAGSPSTNLNIGVARTTDFKSFEVWNGSSWTSTTSSSTGVIDVGSGGSWDDNFVASPAVVHDGSQFVVVYEGSSSGNYQTGIARASSPQGSFTKEATNPILTLDVVDELEKNGSTWVLMGHGGGAGGALSRYSTTDAPADWDSTSFTALGSTFGEEDGKSMMLFSGPTGRPDGRCIYQETTADIELMDVFTNADWRLHRGHEVSVYTADVDVTGGELQMQPDQRPTDYSIFLISADTFTNDFLVGFRRKVDLEPLNRASVVGMGTGLVGPGDGTAYHLPTFENGYTVTVATPGATGITLREYASYALGTTLDTGSLLDTENAAWAIYEWSYLSTGAHEFSRNGTEVVSGTDTTFVSDSKKLFFSQGQRASSDLGGTQHLDWIYVREYDGTDPDSVTLGSEETAGVSGTGTPSEASDTPAASGTFTAPQFTSSGTPTEADDTATASGVYTPPDITGTGTPTEADDTSTGAGTLGFFYTGTGTPTEAVDVSAGSGVHTAPAVTGTGTPSETDDTSAGTAVYQFQHTATGNLTEAEDTSAGTGTFTSGAVTGSGTPTEASDTSTAAGMVINPAVGVGTPTEADDTMAGVGTGNFIQPVWGRRRNPDPMTWILQHRDD